MENSLSYLLFLPWMLAFILQGRFFLNIFKITHLKGLTHLTLCYWVGFATLSLTFFALFCFNALNETTVLAVLGLSALGLWPIKFKQSATHKAFQRFDQGHLLSVLFILACLITLPATMVPPLTGSGLAYHLAIPKSMASSEQFHLTVDSFLQSGPLLTHVHAAAAYILGGETLMMLNSWGMFVLSGTAVYALARRRLRPASSWLFTAVIASLPALTYSAGSGIIEPKLMGVLSIAALTLVQYARSEKLNWLFITALLLAVAMQMHVIGIFAACAFLSTFVLCVKDLKLTKALAHTTLFVCLLTLFASPFYGWAYAQTGQLLLPIFSDLTSMTGWSPMQAALYKQQAFAGVDKSLLDWAFNYPLEIAIQTQNWAVNHLSLGPLFLLAFIPCILMIVKRFSFLSPIAQHWGTQELYALTFMTFYSLWFFYGMEMKPQSLTPVIPLLILPVWMMAESLFARSLFPIRASLITATFVIMAVQFGISSKINQPAVALAFKNITFEEYIQQNMPEMTVAEYLKNSMKKEDKALYTQHGKMNYVLGHKGLYAPAVFQEKIPVAFGSSTDIINNALREGVTLWVTENNPLKPEHDTDYNAHQHLRKLISYGCFVEDSYIEPAPQKSFYIYRYIKNCQGQNQA